MTEIKSSKTKASQKSIYKHVKNQNKTTTFPLYSMRRADMKDQKQHTLVSENYIYSVSREVKSLCSRLVDIL